MKQHADKKFSEHYFTKGDQIFMHFKPYKKIFLKYKIIQKLAPNFFGPFKIIQHIRTDGDWNINGPRGEDIVLPSEKINIKRIKQCTKCDGGELLHDIA